MPASAAVSISPISTAFARGNSPLWQYGRRVRKCHPEQPQKQQDDRCVDDQLQRARRFLRGRDRYHRPQACRRRLAAKRDIARPGAADQPDRELALERRHWRGSVVRQNTSASLISIRRRRSHPMRHSWSGFSPKTGPRSNMPLTGPCVTEAGSNMSTGSFYPMDRSSPCKVLASPTAPGSDLEFVGTVMDITERKGAERRCETPRRTSPVSHG